MSEANKALMRQVVDLFASGDLSQIDGLIAGHYVDHQDGGRGPEGFGHMVSGVRQTFPDLAVVVEDMLADANRVVTRLRWTGTHKATGQRVEAESIDIVRFENGQAVEHWGVSKGWP